MRDDRADPDSHANTGSSSPPYTDSRVPFGLAPDEFTAYAQDKGLPRTGTISSAHNRPVAEIDLDYASVEPEEMFVAENA